MDANTEPVRVYQTEIVLPTYPLGAPDPNPPFPEGRRVDVYPYPLLDDLGETREERTYTALVLENRYLKLTVLPELGGHLYSAYDKTAEREIFYRNNVVKPGLVSLRGAWISGGVEFNFPIGHSVTTVSPVDWRLEKEDGRATIWIGDLERVSRMQWWVGLSLSEDSGAIEQEVILHNRTPLRRRYYFWSNSAVRASDGLQFICPTDYRKVGGHIGPYPVENGRDLSWYKNHEHAADVFAYQVREDWFGWYNHDEDAGLVHVANAPECIGKKMFVWGSHDDGLIWADILSDGDGPYAEVQSGRFEDQAIWKLIQPRSVERWQEWWYPVEGAGPFVKANREAAFALRRKEGNLRVGVYASREITGATLEVRRHDGGRETGDGASADGGFGPPSPPSWGGVGGQTHGVPLRLEGVSAAPGRPFVTALEDPSLTERDLILTLTYAAPDGRQETLEYVPRPTPGPVPQAPPPPPDTAETRSVAGLRAEQAYHMEQAAEQYRRALELDPDYGPAHRGLAVVALWRGLWEEAAAHCERALARDTDDVEARYYRGVAAWEMGDESTARFHLWQAARVPAFAEACQAVLAEMGVREQGAQLADSMELLIASENPRIRALGAITLRHLGKPSVFTIFDDEQGLLEARERYLTARALERQGEPADIAPAMARRGASTRDGSPVTGVDDLLRAWKEHAAGEPEAYLEVAHDYARVGFLDDAIEVLEEGAAEAKAPNPLLFYTLGFLLERAGREEEAGAWFAKGREARPEYCFPHRLESVPVLRRAIEREPKDARARLYLGTLLYARGRKEEAVALWEEAIRLEPDNSLLRRNRGFAAWKAGDLEQAAAHYDAALVVGRGDFHRYIERDRVAEGRGESPEERLARLESAPDAVQRRHDLVARRAALNLLLGHFETAIALVASRPFHPWEGALGMRRVYLDAHVGRGLSLLAAGKAESALASFQAALEYPRNVRVGKPAHPRDAEPLTLAGCAAALLGRSEEARSYWEQAAAEELPLHSELWVWQFLALKQLGQDGEARERLHALGEHACAEVSKSPQSAAAHFLLGLTLLALGKRKEGRESLRTALACDAHHFRARLLSEETVLRAVLR